MVVLGSHRPNNFARWTSHAARSSARRSGRTRVPPAWAEPGPGASDGCLRWRARRLSSRRPRSRTRHGPRRPRPTLSRRYRICARLSPHTADRAERSSCDVATAAKRRALNQRQSVTLLIWATIPRPRTSRRNSGMVQRAIGTSIDWAAHRRAALRRRRRWGEAGRLPASRLFLKAGHAFFEEALAPLADDLPRRIQPGGDDIVAETLGSEQDDLRADNVAIRVTYICGPCFQSRSLVRGEHDEYGLCSA